MWQGKQQKCGLSRAEARYSTPEARLERERIIGPNPWAGGEHNNIGCEFMRMDSVKLAIAEFEKAVELNPWKAVFKVNLARAYIRNSDFEKAEQRLSETMKQEPHSPVGLFAWGLLCEAVGRMEEGIRYYVECLKYCSEGSIKRQAEENLAVLRRAKKKKQDSGQE